MGSVDNDANPYGLKTIVKWLDDKAAWTPHHTYLRYPGPDWETQGYSTITWRQYRDAANRIAHWLDEKLGPDSGNDTIAYMGPNDVRYGLLLPAVVKTGRKLLICDGRITGEGLKSLLKSSECKAWLSADEQWSLKAAGVQDAEVDEKSFPSLEWCLAGVDVPHYPYDKKFEDVKDVPIFIVHTSGTTGHPKPIWCSHGIFGILPMAKIFGKKYHPRISLWDLQRGRVAISAYPPKWVAGLGYMCLIPLMTNHVTIVLPADTVGLPPDLFKKIVRWNPDLEGIHGPPSSIAGLWKDASTQPLVKDLDFILYAGAAFDQQIGDEINKHTRLAPLIASTEGGVRNYTIALDRKLWNTFDYISEAPHRFVKREGYGDASHEELYELVFDRPADGNPSYFNGTFWNKRMFDDVDTMETSELYAPVKDLDGATRWFFRSRADDLTKLSFLAKFKATHIEAQVLRHPAVKHVLVGGEGRPVPYVLIEAKDEVLEKRPAQELLDELYGATIVVANEKDFSEIRIPRQTVLLAKRDKPLKINLKAQVLRRDVENDYKEEIDEAYAKYESAK